MEGWGRYGKGPPSPSLGAPSGKPPSRFADPPRVHPQPSLRGSPATLPAAIEPDT